MKWCVREGVPDSELTRRFKTFYSILSIIYLSDFLPLHYRAIWEVTTHNSHHERHLSGQMALLACNELLRCQPKFAAAGSDVGIQN